MTGEEASYIDGMISMYATSTSILLLMMSQAWCFLGTKGIFNELRAEESYKMNSTAIFFK